MVGTTPVSTLRELSYHFHSDTDEDTAPSGRTFKIDDLHFISLAPFVGNGIFRFIFENIVSINFYIQMESNLDSAALA